MVSASQHTAGRATDARHGSGAARFADGPGSRRRADRRPSGPGHVEHEKNSIFLIAEKQPQRGWRSRAGALCPSRQRAKPLDGHRSGGYARERAGMPVPASILSFHHVDAAATLVTPAATAHPPILFLAADSIHVDACKHVNASVYAVARCMALIRFTFPQSYRPVSLQQPFGGDVSLYSRRRRRRARRSRLRHETAGCQPSVLRRHVVILVHKLPASVESERPVLRYRRSQWGLVDQLPDAVARSVPSENRTTG